MKFSIFKKPISKNSDAYAEETRIDKIVADSKHQPLTWDERTMGDETVVRGQILDRVLNSIEIAQPKRKNNPLARWAVAASLFFAIGLGWYYFQHGGFLGSATNIVLKTDRNEIRKIMLSDGSVVWLNGSTTISYPDHFEGEKRVVQLLEGEAFFDVKHDVSKPFQVKAGKTLTNVLGTAFNISSYVWSENIKVTVTRGKVAVNNKIILPDYQLAYTKATGKAYVKYLEGMDVTSWMQGKLVFNDEPLKVIASMLENKYNVEIRFGDKKMSEARFTGQFEPSDGLHDVLDALTLTRGLSYEAKGAVIFINH